jgi:hypothetical protein
LSRVFARLKKKLSKKKFTKEVAAVSTVIPTTLPKPIEYEILDILEKEEEEDDLPLVTKTKISVVQQYCSDDDSMANNVSSRFVSWGSDCCRRLF